MEDVSEVNRALRALPAVHEVLARLAGINAPHSLVVNEVRAALERARRRLALQGGETPDIAAEVRASLDALRRPSLRRVINATGVVLHTNLGRAPLAPAGEAGYYSNLEYDLAGGCRGKRDVHAGALLERLLGCPAIVVNNNAAAVYLALAALAAGGEAIVSRGELIEIGDGFRIPDIMAASGARLVEVGSTNRTHIDDYVSAIGERTRLLMTVHPSNFRMSGFTGRPSREELAAVGRRHGIPVYEDLGSGCLAPLSSAGIHEPRVQEALASGVDLVSFSGDKLLGGPQAGVLAGREDLVGKLRRHPMYRALRLDKLVIAALENTLRAALFEEWDSLPALRMIRLSPDALRVRAERLAAVMGATVTAGESIIGGGSTPEQTLPTWLVALPGDGRKWEGRLRLGEPPVIARMEQDRLVLDLRTVDEAEEESLARALQIAAVGG